RRRFGLGCKRELAVGPPAFAFGLERSLLTRLELANGFGVLVQELPVIAQAQRRVLDPQLELAERKVVSDPQQLFGTDRIEPDLIEEPQQPLLAVGEIVGLPVSIPHL